VLQAVFRARHVDSRPTPPGLFARVHRFVSRIRKGVAGWSLFRSTSHQEKTTPPPAMRPLTFTLFTALLTCVAVADDLPATLMTTRGRLLASEDFSKPPAPFTGKPVGFASGFSGWRFNVGPTGGKAGRWVLADDTFTGIETPGAKHPATASFGIRYQDAIIQCDVRLNDCGRAAISLARTEGHGHEGLFDLAEPGAGRCVPRAV